VDRRRIELQIRAVVVTLRIERERRDASTMEEFRARARSILDALSGEVRAHPELEPLLQAAFKELEADRGETAEPRRPDQQVR
jgi:hypothetical protein